MHPKNRLLLLLPITAALAVGIYLVSTTHLITKDGPSYIEQAQLFQTNPLQAVKGNYCGYPFLIFLVHKTASAFGLSAGVNGWIIAAQSVTLLSMLAAFIPLYFIGKSFLGREKTLYALLILAFLPYPARFAADVLRDWPYILFLSLGIAVLIAAAKGKKLWLYSAIGIISGLGFFIRPECTQVVIYALLWLVICMISPRYEMTRKKAFLSMILVLVFFAMIVLPYMHIRQQYVPEKIDEFIDKTSRKDNTPAVFNAGLTGNLAESIKKVFERISENLFHYFFIFGLIGFYSRYTAGFKKLADTEKIFATGFLLLNFIMLIWLFYNFGYISRRHCLPLSLLFLFYAPIGLEIIGEKISTTFKVSKHSALKKTNFWFYILLTVGVLICLPCLLEPKRKDSIGLLNTAVWLNQNTSPQDLIAVPDSRISFYAQRRGIQVWKKKDLDGVNFAIAQVKADETKPDWGNEMIWFWLNPEKKDSKLIIYQLP
jgi:4-amino-4-deoxy-L-arabinose transferase-like glycosyltransferase